MKCAGAALFVFAAAAQATVIAPLDLSALVAAADRIAVARVESQAARWTAGRSAIVTEVVLRVEQPVKGELRAGERVKLLREGGELDGVGMLVEGAARFVPGEEVLVFLEQRGGDSWTVGMAQGKLRVQTQGARRVVTRDLAGLELLGPVPSMPPSLDEVLRAIAAAASQEKR